MPVQTPAPYVQSITKSGYACHHLTSNLKLTRHGIKMTNQSLAVVLFLPCCLGCLLFSYMLQTPKHFENSQNTLHTIPVSADQANGRTGIWVQVRTAEQNYIHKFSALMFIALNLFVDTKTSNRCNFKGKRGIKETS